MHVSTSRTCDCVTLHDKWDFADVIKDLEVGRGSWLVSWAQCHHEGPGKRGSRRVRERRREDQTEGGGTSTEDKAQDVGASREKAGEGRKQEFSSGALQKA